MPEVIANTASIDSLARFTPGQRILSVLAEMHRAAHWIEHEDSIELKRCYARALDLMDRICALPDRPKGLKEYRRWREMVAELYTRETSSLEEHKLLENALIILHPESWNAFFIRPAS